MLVVFSRKVWGRKELSKYPGCIDYSVFGLGIHIYIGNCYDNYGVLPCYSFMLISNTDCLSFEDYLCRVETLKHLNREIETDR